MGGIAARTWTRPFSLKRTALMITAVMRLDDPRVGSTKSRGTPGWISPTISTPVPTASSFASSTALITTSPTIVSSGASSSWSASARAESRIV